MSHRSGGTLLMKNYRSISVLPCFWKILEYLTENNLLNCKQLGFQKRYSPEHAILQLVEQKSQSFEKNQFTLGVFNNLSTAFHTVVHETLLKS